MHPEKLIKRILDKTAEVIGSLVLRDVDYNPNTGAAPLLDRELYDHYKEAYATYDDGATTPSTYGKLFEGDDAT